VASTENPRAGSLSLIIWLAAKYTAPQELASSLGCLPPASAQARGVLGMMQARTAQTSPHSRRTGGRHRELDNSMEMDGAGAAAGSAARMRERQQMVAGFEYGPALTVSEDNVRLSSAVFDMLDKDKNGSLETTDFVMAGTIDREVFHRACRPVPRNGLDFHEFVRRCARFCCGCIEPNGIVRGPASHGPQVTSTRSCARACHTFQVA
jgi:hypothetical protein